MRQVINVTDAEIAETESILLPNGCTFDDDARNFIKNWETLDLQAVPGSGKTTALLAKLLILDKRLPFEDGSGVVVLSHTNTAVNEIRNKIGIHCSSLFTYPNFVGTIQSFVDSFFANPFYNNRYGKKIVRIDNDTYRRNHYVTTGLNAWLNRSPGNGAIFHNSRLMFDGRLCAGPTLKDINLNADTPTFKTIRTIKKSIRDSGYITFDEAYIFAHEYINKFPNILNLIQKRFSYAFVDEVQDMDLAQYSLLETVFATNGGGISFQRIGDLNQAIYHDHGSASDIWTDRAIVLPLENSRRLTPNIARAVEPFGLNPISINGCRVAEESIENIKPHIILYDDTSITNVLGRFTEVVQHFIDSGAIVTNAKTSHIAIGWTSESDPIKGHIKLDGYFPSLNRKSAKNRLSIDSLDELMKTSVLNNTTRTLKYYKDDILIGILAVLKLEGVKNSDERFFSATTLFKFLSDEKPEEFELLKAKITELVFCLMKNDTTNTLRAMRAFCTDILGWFDLVITNSRTYIDTEFEEEIELEEGPAKPNVYIGNNDIEVTISSVHSVKGQTHTTTLYLETFFNKGYESTRLPKQFAQTQFANTKKRHIQSTKMAYVGFSRPTHLLCVAIHNNNYTTNLAELDLSAWEIVNA